MFKPSWVVGALLIIALGCVAEPSTSGQGVASADAGEDESHDAAVILSALPFECAAEQWQLNRVDVGEVTLNVACRAAADKRAPLIVLLHGYPELHLTWNKLAAPLIERGFALLAPDQRGYNLSDKPEPVAAYAIERIVEDLHGLIEARGRERVLLVGAGWCRSCMRTSIRSASGAW